MNLLVAIDLSPSTDTVVKKTRDLAKALSAKVWLIHVADPEPTFVGYDVGPQYERDAIAEKLRHEHTSLQAIADTLRAEGLDSTALLVQGTIVETILKEAAKLNVDMIKETLKDYKSETISSVIGLRKGVFIGDIENKFEITYIQCFYLKNTEYSSGYISKYPLNYGNVIEGCSFWYIYTVFNWCLMENTTENE